MPIFGAQNFTLNQYLRSLNYNMDKNSIFWVESKKEESWNLVQVSKTLDSIFWKEIVAWMY